jgi:hypothetical protein
MRIVPHSPKAAICNPCRIVPLPQLLLEPQRVDLVADLLVALPDQVRVEVHVMVHVLLLLWLSLAPVAAIKNVALYEWSGSSDLASAYEELFFTARV